MTIFIAELQSYNKPIVHSLMVEPCPSCGQEGILSNRTLAEANRQLQQLVVSLEAQLKEREEENEK